MPTATMSAVIVPVPEADRLVGDYRSRLDRSARWGVPAHVTVLFPFASPDELSGELISRLRETFTAAAPFDCTFTRCGWFGEEVLWLAPDAADAFRDLTAGVQQRFPEHRPYGGRFDELVPHLTIGESLYGDVADLVAAEADVSARLPLSARISHGLLIAGADAPDSWHTVAELPLGPARA